jgi:NADPH2:quinone reductase
MVGGDYVQRNLSLLGDEGRLVFIAFLRGATAQVSFEAVMRRRLTITGSTLRPRPVAFKAAIAAALRREVWPLFEAGSCAPVIDATFPLAEAARAHERIEADHVGKIVLTV